MQKQLCYLIGRDISCKDTLYKRLDQFMNEHMPKLDYEDKKELFENMQLLRKYVIFRIGMLLRYTFLQNGKQKGSKLPIQLLNS